MDGALIRLQGVDFAYRAGEPVLAGLDLALGPGLTLLLGPNGAGKSSLLRLCAGVERPDRGRVELAGHDAWSDEVAARRHLAYVPEHPDLTPYATIGEVVALVCRLRGAPASAGVAALARLGLGELHHRSVRELSMGQRRRALLAAARVGTPRIALLDEPLEALDRQARADLLAWVDELLAGGAAVVVASHEIEPFAAAATAALTVLERRAALHRPLPSERSRRMDLLERLARGAAAAGIELAEAGAPGAPPRLG